MGNRALQTISEALLDRHIANCQKNFGTAEYCSLNDVIAREYKNIYGDEAQLIADLHELSCGQHNIAKINLSQARLNNFDLSAHNLTDANLANICAENIKLSSAILVNTNLSGAHMPNADLSVASLENVDLSFANLSGAKFNCSKFINVNLTGAILINVTGLSNDIDVSMAITDDNQLTNIINQSNDDNLSFEQKAICKKINKVIKLQDAAQLLPA